METTHCTTSVWYSKLVCLAQPTDLRNAGFSHGSLLRLGSRFWGHVDGPLWPGVGGMLLDLPFLILGDAQQKVGDSLKIAGKVLAIDVDEQSSLSRQSITISHVQLGSLGEKNM